MAAGMVFSLSAAQGIHAEDDLSPWGDPLVGGAVMFPPPHAALPQVTTPPADRPLTVRRVQEALNKEGHRVDITGIMDVETRAALRLYQHRHGLVPDGFIDQPTLRALEQSDLKPDLAPYLD